jgi:hypothetical protein
MVGKQGAKAQMVIIRPGFQVFGQGGRDLHFNLQAIDV